ncbi:MAG: DUF2079 domain-containing protein [Planctomycetaceae bacterium]
MKPTATDPRRLLWSVLFVLGGVFAQTLSWQTILSAESTVTCFFSRELWQSLVVRLGGQTGRDQTGDWIAEVDFLPVLLVVVFAVGMSSLLAAWLVRRNTRASWSDSLATAGFAFGWWWLMGVWEAVRLLAFGFGWENLEQLLFVTPQFWQAIALAGWLAHPFASPPPLLPSSPPPGTNPSASMTRNSSVKALAALIALYIVVFTAMNWRLWDNLRIPHGDSAMYEEHLWNLWHGKGFRSYLDQGLFLGEHIQVIHLLLLPLHLLWPSHLLLELCESTALALGAIPVFRMARRSTGSDRAGLLMSAAYLLYFPLHFLDIEVDLKTFRPESFCVPFFLFAFDALEEKRFRRALILLAIALSAKEDYSIIIAPLGAWIAASVWWSSGKMGQRHSAFGFRLSADQRAFGLGCGLAVFGVAYLLLATRVVIPWFRGGAELHYVKYFSKFGNTMSEVVWNMLTNPSLLFGELLTVKTALYALAMLLPVGFVALLSPGRLAVGLPLFGILCLNELAADPRHHFHAPLVPVVFWATAVGVGNAGNIFKKLAFFFSSSPPPLLPSSPWNADSFARQFVWASAFASGLFLSLSPAGITFWDPYAPLSLWRLYAHDSRADHIKKLLAKVPPTARVASTDFVHSRFTHHERSYDYSGYLRREAGYEDRVPDDTDFIVIDRRHPYSLNPNGSSRSLDQVRELRTDPDHWELLPDDTDGHFIVLRRSSPNNNK